MSRLRRPAAPAPGACPTGEDPIVRQYRFLLRTAPADALEAAHAEALHALAADRRQQLLGVLQGTFLVGGHLRESDTRRLAHLVTVTERRTPGALLTTLRHDVLRDLAGAAVEAEAAFGLLNGYPAWDGRDPVPEDDSLWADGGFNPGRGGIDVVDDPRRDQGFRFGGGGGGG